MKITFWLGWSFLIMVLATGVLAQPDTAAPAAPSLPTPTNTMLALSNVSGEVRVLDARGLVLEANFSFLPRIKLSDLSPAELQALLETKPAYAALTEFSSLHGTNGQGAALESQLQQTWRQGTSLAEKIQTRLEILNDLREYNITLALLPATMAAAGQYEVHASALDDRLTNHEAQAEQTPQNSAAGVPNARASEHHARERTERANGKATTANGETATANGQTATANGQTAIANSQAAIANGQAIAANQQVHGYLAKCVALSARLATHGITVPAAPPFSPIPPLTMKAEVDADRRAN